MPRIVKAKLTPQKLVVKCLENFYTCHSYCRWALVSENGCSTCPQAAGHRLFETEHLRPNLRRRSVRGAVVTMLGQAGRFMIQLAGVAVLARLLLPTDFGVFGKTIALAGFIAVVQTGGLSLATIQRAQITHEQISTLFWLNAALGVVAAGMIAALSPAIAWFYDDPRVLWLGLALAGVVAISGLTVQHDALMQRQMRFTAIAVIYIITLITGFAAAILCAWRGAGFWALAVQQYVSSLTFCCCCWRAAAGCPVCPAAAPVWGR